MNSQYLIMSRRSGLCVSIFIVNKDNGELPQIFWGRVEVILHGYIV